MRNTQSESAKVFLQNSMHGTGTQIITSSVYKPFKETTLVPMMRASSPELIQGSDSTRTQSFGSNFESGMLHFAAIYNILEPYIMSNPRNDYE